MNFIRESFSYKVTMTAGKELYLEGHRGISSYNDSEIVIRLRGEKIKVIGECLIIDEINEDEVLIKGKILSFGVVE